MCHRDGTVAQGHRNLHFNFPAGLVFAKMAGMNPSLRSPIFTKIQSQQCWIASAPLFLFCTLAVMAAADDILLADFEGETYGDWKATGEAFGPGPARGTLPNQMPVSGFLGHGLVNSFYKG